MSERLGAAPYVQGFERETVSYVERHRKPLVPLAKVIEVNTTLGRGKYDVRFDNLRLDQEEDSLALSTALAAMEFADRKNQHTLDVQFAQQVLLELHKAQMVHGNMDVKSESESAWIMPVRQAVELSVTDNRGYEPVGRVRVNGIEDTLAIRERIAWMTLARASVIYRSSAEEWSTLNILARMAKKNMDTLEDGEKVNVILVSPEGEEAFLAKISAGNINAHFGGLIKKDGSYPMYWHHDFAKDHLPEIIASQGETPNVELWKSQRVAIASAPMVQTTS